MQHYFTRWQMILRLVCLAGMVWHAPSLCFADELCGTVVDAAGKPLSGVRVDVATAAPKVGEGLFCPSCYLDCSKSARTDTQGRFEFKAMDPNLKFRLLATAPDKQSAATGLIDPALEKAVIQLADFPKGVAPGRVLLGVVQSEDGAPIPGALVSPSGAKTKDMRWTGTVKGASAAVTDEQGKFRMLLAEDFVGVDVEVIAEGCAGAVATLLAPGEKQHVVRVPAGATVRGRLIYEGQPQRAKPVAVVQLNRGGDGVFLKAVPTVTDADGSFRISALPAGEPYAIFTPVTAGAIGPVIPTSLFKVQGSGSMCDVGAIELVSSVSLSGVVRIRDGSVLPGGIAMTLGRLPAWDLIEVKIGRDGRFRIDGLPPETYELRLKSDGFAADDDTDRRYQRLSPNTWGLRLDVSRSDVEIVVRPQAKDEKFPPAAKAARLSRNAKGGQVLSGKVIDLGGKPVRGLQIGVRQHGAFDSLATTTKSRSDGSFKLANLPDEPLDLVYFDPRVRGYPVGSNGVSMLYTGYARPTLNQPDVQLLFDAALAKRPRDLGPVTGESGDARK